jgi:hypothetical protein
LSGKSDDLIIPLSGFGPLVLGYDENVSLKLGDMVRYIQSRIVTL